MKFGFLLIIYANMYIIKASVLMWNSKSLNIPALKKFNDEDFTVLLRQLNNPKVAAFNTPVIYSKLQSLLTSRNSAYIPGACLKIDNATDLSGIEDEDIFQIKSTIEQFDGDNYIIVLIQNDKRVRRSVEENFTNTSVEPPVGPVLYKKDEIMIYSSKTPLLRLNNLTFYLGKASVITIDKRNVYSYTRLNVNFPVGDGNKLAVRFKFPWTGGYWSLSSVEIEDIDGNTYNLTLKDDIEVPYSHSYHCTGKTVYSDEKNNNELILYDLQVQLYTKNNRFSNAFDCTYVTSSPILSGLFVTFIMIFSLFVSLDTLADIQTMDKFDTQKTKQLSITVSE